MKKDMKFTIRVCHIIGVMFNSLYDNPRFIEIIQKMNLPLPED